MPRTRIAAVAALALFAFTSIASAAPRWRSADAAQAGAWLARNAFPIASTDPAAPARDLEPLRAMVGTSSLVGLGDVTHGTHEFFALKLRLIDFLVRELNFDTLAIEAPFPLTNELDAYIHGGGGDPRAILGRAGALNYLFWDNEEFLAVVEWLRAWNVEHPANEQVTLAGFDIYDEANARQNVIAYLRRVAPAAAAAAETAYAPEKIVALLDARRAELDGAEYQEALQHARVTLQHELPQAERDASMAANALWIRAHRGRGKVMLWAHQEHLGRTPTYLKQTSMGELLARDIPDYFVIGQLAGRGSFLQAVVDPRMQRTTVETRSFRAASADSYESLLADASVPRMLIPLRGNVPAWLQGPAPYRSAGSVPSPQPDWSRSESLPAKFDAVIFIEETTAARPLAH